MAREDARYEIDRLLLERGITTAEMCSLIPEIGVLPAKGMTREMKTLVLMRWMNREWNRIENGERTHADMELTKAVISHMTDVAHSEPCDMVAVKKAEGAVFSREEADAPEKVKLGNLIRP